MKKSIIIALFFSCVFQLGLSQNLDLIYAEKFDFREVTYDNNAGFGEAAIICNHLTDLSYFDADFDPMGVISGSLFFHDFDDTYYAGTFNTDSEVKLLDINLNENTSHQTILLDLGESCSFSTPEEEDLNFEFPELANMTGIINSNNSSGGDSFWVSYILAVEDNRPNLWSAGDLTIITGSDIEGELQYINPDGSIIDITVTDGYNQYLIAIDVFGIYQWSYVYQNSEYDILGGVITSVEEHNGEILVSSNLAVEDGLLIIGNILYLDSSGNQVKDLAEFPWVFISKLDFDALGNMLICGVYYGNVGSTNMDLNGGAYYFDENMMQIFNGFLLKYEPNGAVDWAQTLEGPGSNRGASFDFTDDFIYLTGEVSDGVVFDKNGDNTLVFNNIGKNKLYISKYLRDGSLEWVNIFESASGAQGGNISIEGDEITLFGSFITALDADPNPLEEQILTNENPNTFQSFFVLDFNEMLVSTSNIVKVNTTLSPNPASYILSASNSNEKIISIKSLAGNSVGQYNSSSIDVSDLPNGMYIVNTENNGEIASQLISIIH